MREIRPYGSEGGAGANPPFLPLSPHDFPVRGSVNMRPKCGRGLASQLRILHLLNDQVSMHFNVRMVLRAQMAQAIRSLARVTRIFRTSDAWVRAPDLQAEDHSRSRPGARICLASSLRERTERGL